MKRIFAAAIFFLIFFPLNAFSVKVTDRVLEVCNLDEDTWQFSTTSGYEAPGYENFGSGGDESALGLGEDRHYWIYTYHFFKEQDNNDWQGSGWYDYTGSEFPRDYESVKEFFTNWYVRILIDGERYGSEIFSFSELRKVYPFFRQRYIRFFGGVLEPLDRRARDLGTTFNLVPNSGKGNYKCNEAWTDYGDGGGEQLTFEDCPKYSYTPPSVIDVICPRACDRYLVDFEGDIGAYGLFPNWDTNIVDEKYKPCRGMTVTQYDITCEGVEFKDFPMKPWQFSQIHHHRVEGVCSGCGNGHVDKYCGKGDMHEGAPCTDADGGYIEGACDDGSFVCVETEFEQCDNGNGNGWGDDDECNPFCQWNDDGDGRKCGNGVLDSGEQCEINHPCQNGNACNLYCRCEGPPVCGNGVPETGEACDDGNTADGDGCSSSCVVEYCGDTIVQRGLGEECDNGKHCENGVSCQTDSDCVGIGDQLCKPRSDGSCDATCKLERCIDGTPCYDGSPETEGVGICHGGNLVCSDPPVCDGQQLPKVEECNNGLDDDCDGQTDEGCPICGNGIIEPPTEKCELTSDCSSFGDDLICFQCQCVKGVDDYWQLGVLSESVYKLGDTLAAALELKRTVFGEEKTAQLHYYIINLNGEKIGAQSDPPPVEFQPGSDKVSYPWGDVALSAPAFQAGTYILVASVDAAEGEKFTANNHASKYITITSQEVEVNIPETSPLLVVLLAFSVVFILRRK